MIAQQCPICKGRKEIDAVTEFGDIARRKCWCIEFDDRAPYFEPAAGEWCMMVSGRLYWFDGHQSNAYEHWLDKLRIRNDHRRNDAIPFLGEPVPQDDVYRGPREEVGL